MLAGPPGRVGGGGFSRHGLPRRLRQIWIPAGCFDLIHPRQLRIRPYLDPVLRDDLWTWWGKIWEGGNPPVDLPSTSTPTMALSPFSLLRGRSISFFFLLLPPPHPG